MYIYLGDISRLKKIQNYAKVCKCIQSHTETIQNYADTVTDNENENDNIFSVCQTDRRVNRAFYKLKNPKYPVGYLG